MAMSFGALLTRVIDDGIAEVKSVYIATDARTSAKRRGAIDGLEACRGKDVNALNQALIDARNRTADAMSRYHTSPSADASENYWYHRFYELQIEWVCNVCASACSLTNQPHAFFVASTARGMASARRIIGFDVGNENEAPHG